MPEQRPITAGPLSLILWDGELRRIMLGDHEVLCRIYFALRDRNWGTIGGRIENLVLEQRERHFSVTYDSVHQHEDIDFRWHATIIGAASGKVSFALDGKAYSTFKRNRVGLCVHHPLAGCAGKPCTVTRPDGGRETLAFPDFVAPHQPFLNVAAMSHEVQPGIHAEVRFFGEVFETEDHRNWTDANFKTYGTPLSLPFPVEVTAGSEIHQRVELSLAGKTIRPSAPARAKLVSVRVTEKPLGSLPELGLGPARGGKPLPADALGQVKRLNLSHLRADIPLDRDPVAAMEQAIAGTKALGLKLEAAVFLPGPLADLRRFAPSVARWLIFHTHEKSTPAETAALAREILGPDAAVVAGTNAYFAELNRNRPSGAGWNASCFSINPQVHAFDNDSVMENTLAQGHAVRSARHFTGGRPVIVTPVSLRPRFNPDATAAGEPLPPDPRQKTSFCAAWTTGSLKHLSEAGAASITYFETHGAGGVFDEHGVYPVFKVLSKLGEFRGGHVLAVESGDQRRVLAFAAASGARRCMLLANQTSESQTAQCSTPAQTVEIAPFDVAILDWNR
ncbi:MAG: hypothetical protein IT161_11940 [Bryobacterales bacterium]|nr:hypothetical protein [Bryobacterales bacterium]